MIKSLNAGYGITINGSSYTDPYISPGSVGAGMLRWNPNMNCMEVNDGSMWKSFQPLYPTIELNYEVKEVIEWAKNKMQEEKKIDELCQQYPGLGKARDNYETFLRLVESQEPI